MSEPIDLASVVAELAAGQAQAMQPLYERYAGQLYRFCWFRLADSDAAHDCVQEVFLLVWRGIRALDYRGEQAFSAWLYAIASNVVIDELRRRPRSTSVSLTDELADRALGMPDHARTVCDRLMLEDALLRLNRDQQLVLQLRYGAGLSNRDVGRIMRRSEGAIKLLHHRAIKRLYRYLVAYEAVENEGVALLAPARG